MVSDICHKELRRLMQVVHIPAYVELAQGFVPDSILSNLRSEEEVPLQTMLDSGQALLWLPGRLVGSGRLYVQDSASLCFVLEKRFEWHEGLPWYLSQKNLLDSVIRYKGSLKCSSFVRIVAGLTGMSYYAMQDLSKGSVVRLRSGLGAPKVMELAGDLLAFGEYYERGQKCVFRTYKGRPEGAQKTFYKVDEFCQSDSCSSLAQSPSIPLLAYRIDGEDRPTYEQFAGLTPIAKGLITGSSEPDKIRISNFDTCRPFLSIAEQDPSCNKVNSYMPNYCGVHGVHKDAKHNHPAENQRSRYAVAEPNSTKSDRNSTSEGGQARSGRNFIQKQNSKEEDSDVVNEWMQSILDDTQDATRTDEDMEELDLREDANWGPDLEEYALDLTRRFIFRLIGTVCGNTGPLDLNMDIYSVSVWKLLRLELDFSDNFLLVTSSKQDLSWALIGFTQDSEAEDTQGKASDENLIGKMALHRLHRSPHQYLNCFTKAFQSAVASLADNSIESEILSSSHYNNFAILHRNNRIPPHTNIIAIEADTRWVLPNVCGEWNRLFIYLPVWLIKQLVISTHEPGIGSSRQADIEVLLSCKEVMELAMNKEIEIEKSRLIQAY